MYRMGKKNIPHGLLRKIAKAAKSSAQSVGISLGIYESTTIGVSSKRRDLILATAIEVAKKEKDELDDFIDSISISKQICTD